VAHRAGPVRHDEAKGREVGEDTALRLAKVEHRDALLGYEVGAVRLPETLASGGVDEAGDVELDHLLVEREPVFVVQRRHQAGPLGGVRVDEAADELVLRDAAIQLFDAGLDAPVWCLRQSADTAKDVRACAALPR